jgi:DNA-binding NarL/FixJ family response regulator
MNNLPRVLIIDENASDRALASLVLTGEFGNLEIDAVGTAAEFAGALAAGRFGIVISEAVFSWSTGLELIRLVRDVRPDCPVILFTAEVGEELWGETLRLGVDGYISKSSAGFVRLPAVVRSVFFRTRRQAVATSRDAPYRRLVEDLPDPVRGTRSGRRMAGSHGDHPVGARPRYRAEAGR